MSNHNAVSGTTPNLAAGVSVAHGSGNPGHTDSDLTDPGRHDPDKHASAKQGRTLTWVVTLSTILLIFDGYDLVVYGTAVPKLLADPSQLGPLTASQAGLLGSYALVGVLVGALAAGAIGDWLGRRRVILFNIVLFSIGMGITAFMQSVTAFGLMRFITGLGVGALVGTIGAYVAEFARPEQKNRINAIVYSGVPAGGVMAALLALIIGPQDWRILFAIGALPLVIVLPVALFKLPESPRWLMARGRVAQAEQLAANTGITLTRPAADQAPQKVGFSALATRQFAWPTLLLGLMSFAGLLLTYALNTWLPKIMADNGYDANYSLTFLLVLNLGAIIGGMIASYVADRVGARRVVATTFALAALTLMLLPLQLPFAVLLVAVAIAGTGTIGTQVLIYGLVSNYYPTRARAAGVAWCAGFGRLGGIIGPAIGGFLVAAGLGGSTAFMIFAGVAVVGAAVTLLVPRSPEDPAGKNFVAGSPNKTAASQETMV